MCTRTHDTQRTRQGTHAHARTVGQRRRGIKEASAWYIDIEVYAVPNSVYNARKPRPNVRPTGCTMHVYDARDSNSLRTCSSRPAASKITQKPPKSANLFVVFSHRIACTTHGTQKNRSAGVESASIMVKQSCGRVRQTCFKYAE